MNNNYYKAGSWNVQCDRCAQKYKREQCRKEWTGLLVCENCFDPRHPVTLPLPAIKESLSVPDARPRQSSQTPNRIQGLSRWGVSYLGKQGLDPNLTWGAWTGTWGDEPTTSTDIFPFD